MDPAVPTTPSESARRRSIAFINWAHALDHYVILIYPTVVIGLEAVYARTYAELIALSTASFVAFGVFALPAGWLADHWSRRNMMAAFYLGCGVSLIAAGAASGPIALATALFVLGIFAAIYHPVGTAMLVEAAASRGRSMAFNGVCGNLGVAFAAGITAWLAVQFGWRWAFFVPAAVCIVSGLVYLWLVPDERTKASARATIADVPLTPWIAAAIFGLFVMVALTAGLIFHIYTVALPKVVDERLGADIPLVLIGSIATARAHVRSDRPAHGRPPGGEISAAHPVRCHCNAAVHRRPLVGDRDRQDAAGSARRRHGGDLRPGHRQRPRSSPATRRMPGAGAPMPCGIS